MIKNINNENKRYYGFIDGLRAIAVLLVFIFHLNPEWLSGGFIGVDVFFTISGFLITQILVSDSNLSYKQFLLARVRRLSPAMAIVITSILVLAVLVVSLPSELNSLSKSVITSSSYISNIFFYSTANYFDSTRESNMLLHTWSLAVEWQFYFIYPLLIYLFVRKKIITISLLLIAITSLIAAEVIILDDVDAVFYLTPFRAFEFTMGGVVFVLVNGKKKTIPFALVPLANLMVVVGIAALLLLAFTFDESTLFPGLNAFWVSLATCLILYTGLKISNHNRALGILDNAPARYLGSISYSLYLWHWPIIIIFRLYEPELSLFQLSCITAVSFILAHFTHHLFENRFRGRRATNNFYAIGLALVPIFAGLCIYSVNKYYPSLLVNLTEEEQAIIDIPRWEAVPGECKATHSSHEYYDCVLGDVTKDPTLLVFGDSHAQMHAWSLHEKLIELEKSAVYLTKGGCPPLIGAVLAKTIINKLACLDIQNRFVDALKENATIKIALVAARWHVYHNQVILKNNKSHQKTTFEKELEKTVSYLSQNVSKVIIMDSLPEAPAPAPELIVRNMRLGNRLETFENKAQNYKPLQSFKNEKIEVVNLEALLCIEHSECAYFIDNDLVLFDSNHLTQKASNFVLDRINLNSD